MRAKLVNFLDKVCNTSTHIIRLGVYFFISKAYYIYETTGLICRLNKKLEYQHQL